MPLHTEILSNGDKCFIALVVVASVVVAIWRGRGRKRGC